MTAPLSSPHLSPTPSAEEGLPLGRYVDLVRDQSHRFAEVARATPPTARSRSYPGYDAGSLTLHVGTVLAHSAHLLRTGEPLSGVARPALPPHRSAPDWVEDAAADLQAAAALADPQATVPTYPTGELRPRWTVYRSALTEVAVHRYDLESAAPDRVDSRPPVPADLAADILDSVFTWWAPRLLADRRIGLYLGGTVTLHAVDADASWAVTVDEAGALIGRRIHPTGLHATGLHATGDRDAEAVLAGPADLVLLAVWKRVPLDSPGLAVHGPEALVHRLLRIPYVPDPQITAAH